MGNKVVGGQKQKKKDKPTKSEADISSESNLADESTSTTTSGAMTANKQQQTEGGGGTTKQQQQQETKGEKEQLEKALYKEAKDAFIEGNRLFRGGRFDLAKSEYANALKILKNKESVDDEDVSKATALSNIAILDFADGRYEEAKNLLEEALALRKGWLFKKRAVPTPTSGSGSPRSANDLESMEALSVALGKDNRFCRAPEEQKILAKELKEHGAIDSVIADTINNLAACLEILGYLDEARQLYEESLALRKVVHGENSLKVAESMQNLATILDSQGHLCEAEELLEKSLEIQKSLSGDNSPEAAVSMNNLGVLCTHLGQLDKAQKLLEEAVTTRILYYGDDHQLTLCAKRNLQYVKNKRASLAQRPLSESVNVSM